MAYAEDDSTSSPSLAGFVAGLGVFLAVYFLASGLEDRQRMVAATFAGAVILWMTEALPLAMTAMLSTAALVVTGGLSTKEAFGAYGDQIILLFVGSFIIAKSMEENGLDRRIAFWLLAKPRATRSASSTLLVLGIVACLISLFVSNTATTAMLLPIGLTILREIGVLHRGNPIANSYLLMLTWGSSIAVGTIIGTPPNVIGVGMIRDAAGVNINFVTWAVFAMPITILMLLFAWFQLSRWKMDTYVPNTDEAHEYAREQLRGLGRLRDGERITLIAFAVAIVFWLLPGSIEYIFGPASPTTKWWTDRFPEAIAALLGAAVLFILPCKDGTRALSWRQATRIEWGTILLFAGGLALGKATLDSGLAKAIGDSVAQTVGSGSVWTITGIATALAIILSELASNTASANIVVPVAIALAQGSGVDIVPPALGATIGANLGFMLPISTAPNAIVYSSGIVPANVMLRAGVWFDVAGFLVTMLCLRIFLPLLGLA
ncbi:MAG: Sodium-dependent dicarboxylate transporter SdcS [Fimbriimonadaceae bacterium]|nr:Sodium-dependent dicarboxylate transporter SdcS [Fimbriimonadaceae bacterium]